MLIRERWIVQVESTKGDGPQYGIPFAGHYLYYPYCKDHGQALYTFIKIVHKHKEENIYTDCFTLKPRYGK